MAEDRRPHNLGMPGRSADDHESVVLWADRELAPLPGALHPYAVKWRAMAEQAKRLPADDRFRQRMEEAAALISRIANRSDGLYALAVNCMPVAFRRVREPKAGEINGDDRRARKAM